MVPTREEAIAANVIVGTFTLFNVTVYALIELGLTHSYICTTLVKRKKNLPIELTEFDIRVSNLIG